MSFKSFNNSSPNIFSKNVTPRYVAPTPLPYYTPDIAYTWSRNPAWLNFTIPSGSEEKFIGLYAVLPNYNTNFLAISGGTGNYTIDWGDGTVENINYTSGINKTGMHIYDYNSTGLNNSDIPITFDAASDTVTLNSHKYISGSTISFAYISGANGLAALQPYTVANITPNTFQLTSISSGNIVDITSDGSGVILPYKQAIVTLTPQAGYNLTNLNLHLKYPSGDLPRYYNNSWLDIAISGPLLTGLKIGTNTPMNSFDMYVRNDSLERLLITEGKSIDFRTLCNSLHGLRTFKYLGSGKMSSVFALFENCWSLIDIEIRSTSNCTEFYGMFNLCYSLRIAPDLDLQNATNTSSMFNNCNSLKFVPNYCTTGVQIFNSMFASCSSLKEAPVLDYRSATNVAGLFNNCGSLQVIGPINGPINDAGSMFSACSSLIRAPYVNTKNATNFQTMFQGCSNLEIVPAYDTSNATNLYGMFLSCQNLENVPYMITTGVTDMTNMFNGCLSLKTVPLFDTRNVTNMSRMFEGCYALERIPTFNTNKVTNFSNMFLANNSLKEVAIFNTSGNGSLAISMSNMFRDCVNLYTIPKFEMSGVNNTSSMFQNCRSLTYLPPINTKNVTNATNMFNGCRSLVAVTGLDFSNNTDFTSMFEACGSLETVSIATNSIATNFTNIFYQNRAIKNINMTIQNATNLTNAFYECPSLLTLPKITSPNISNINNAFVNNYSLSIIPNLILTGVTSAGNFTTPFSNCYSLAKIEASGYRVSFSVAGTSLSAPALNQIFSGLYPGAAQTITITSALGANFCDRSIASGKSWVVIG